METVILRACFSLPVKDRIAILILLCWLPILLLAVVTILSALLTVPDHLWIKGFIHLLFVHFLGLENIFFLPSLQDA